MSAGAKLLKKLVAVYVDDLQLLMEQATALDEAERVPLNAVLARCGEALAGVKDGSEEESGTAPGPPLPPGVYGRTEMPGYRTDTGWITEETRFGLQVAVVRDWSGCEVAAVALGPGCRVVYLPTPLRRPETAVALAIESPDPWQSVLSCDGSAPCGEEHCPDHGHTLGYHEDQGGEFEQREHLWCGVTGCEYEVWVP